MSNVGERKGLNERTADEGESKDRTKEGMEGEEEIEWKNGRQKGDRVGIG